MHGYSSLFDFLSPKFHQSSFTLVPRESLVPGEQAPIRLLVEVAVSTLYSDIRWLLQVVRRLIGSTFFKA